MVMTMPTMNGKTVARAAGAATMAAPYVRRLIRDQQLRDSVRDLIQAANHLYSELSDEDRLHKLVNDDQVRKDVDQILEAAQHAGRRVIRPRRRTNWMAIAIVGGIAGGIAALIVYPRSRRGVVSVVSRGQQTVGNVIPMRKAA